MITMDDLTKVKFYKYPQSLSFAYVFEIRCQYQGVTQTYSKKVNTKELEKYGIMPVTEKSLLEGLLDQLNRDEQLKETK